MKLNLTIDIDDRDHVGDIEDEIIREAARQMINEVMNNKYERPGRTFREKLQEEVKTMMLDIMDTDFKEDVKNTLADDLSKKYLKTKQYKEIKNQFEIENESVIKSGLKDIVSDLVKSEMKKVFNN